MVLAVTNIIGVPVGGFEVPYTLLTDTKAQTFHEVCTEQRSMAADYSLQLQF